MMNLHIENQPSNFAERVDLSEIVEDTTLSLHPHADHNLQQSTLCAKIEVLNLTQIYATATALLSIKRASQTVPFVIEQYAKNYAAKLFRAASRGNDKGLLVLDPTASTYVHRLSDGNELVVQGETIQVDGEYTRRLTISCRNELTLGVSA
jgi:hypothetical protein